MSAAALALTAGADGLSAWEEQCWYTPRAAAMYDPGQVRLFFKQRTAAAAAGATAPQLWSLLRTDTFVTKARQWWQVCLRREGGTYTSSCASCPQVSGCAQGCAPQHATRALASPTRALAPPSPAPAPLPAASVRDYAVSLLTGDIPELNTSTPSSGVRGTAQAART